MDAFGLRSSARFATHSLPNPRRVRQSDDSAVAEVVRESLSRLLHARRDEREPDPIVT
jgi:hypothetical protein